MQIIDTHCHAGRNWFEPIETLLFQMDSNGVDGAVLIQHGGTYDNDYLFECAEAIRAGSRSWCWSTRKTRTLRGH